MVKESVKVTLRVDVDRQLLLDLIVTAFEGGSNYWFTEVDAEFSEIKRDDDLNYLSALITFGEDVNDLIQKGSTAVVNPEVMAVGLERLAQATFPAAAKHLADALSENGDAITADVVLQMGIFGEVVFG